MALQPLLDRLLGNQISGPEEDGIVQPLIDG